MFKKKNGAQKEFLTAAGSVQTVTLCSNSGYAVSRQATKRVFFLGDSQLDLTERSSLLSLAWYPQGLIKFALNSRKFEFFSFFALDS